MEEMEDFLLRETQMFVMEDKSVTTPDGSVACLPCVSMKM